METIVAWLLVLNVTFLVLGIVGLGLLFAVDARLTHMWRWLGETRRIDRARKAIAPPATLPAPGVGAGAPKGQLLTCPQCLDYYHERLTGRDGKCDNCREPQQTSPPAPAGGTAQDWLCDICAAAQVRAGGRTLVDIWGPNNTPYSRGVCAKCGDTGVLCRYPVCYRPYGK